VSRTVQAIVVVVSLVVVAGGAFYAGNAIVGSQAPTTQPTPTAILEEAKKRVPPPVLPPKPAGRETVVLVNKPIEVTTPTVRMVTKEIGLGIRVQVPVQETKRTTIITQVPQTKLVDASPEEIAAWDKEVTKLQEQYHADLQQELTRIYQEERLKNDKQIIEMAKDVVKNVVAPLLASLAGLITALTVLLRGYAPIRTARKRQG